MSRFFNTTDTHRAAFGCRSVSWKLASAILSFFGFCSALAQEQLKQPLVELSLRVQFQKKFIAKAGAQSQDYENICEAFAYALRPGQGPWGFGIFERLAACEFDGKAEINRDLTVWTLHVGYTSKQLGAVKLCRPMPAQKEKCEALVVIPTKVYLKDLLQNRNLVKLLAASLLDQAPVRSKLTPNLVSNDTIQSAPETTAAGEFALPPYSQTLIPASVSIFSKQGSLSVTLKKEQPSKLLTEKTVWLLTDTRDTMHGQLFELIAKATTAITTSITAAAESERMLSATAADIVGHVPRRKAKQSRNFWGKIETEAELRTALLFSDANSYASVSNFEALFAQDVFKNLWFEGAWHKGSTITSATTESGTESTLLMFRNVFFGSIGWGVRWSSLSDHTVFAYPTHIQQAGESKNCSEYLCS